MVLWLSRMSLPAIERALDLIQSVMMQPSDASSEKTKLGIVYCKTDLALQGARALVGAAI